MRGDATCTAKSMGGPTRTNRVRTAPKDEHQGEAAPTVQAVGAAKYRRVGDLTVQPVVFNDKAYEDAKRYYSEHSDLSFHNDLFDYLQNGFVVSRPNLFGMAKVIEYEGRRGWFVRFAITTRKNSRVEDFIELAVELLRYAQLPFIAFCRDNDHDLRIIDLPEFLTKAVACNLKRRTNRYDSSIGIR